MTWPLLRAQSQEIYMKAQEKRQVTLNHVFMVLVGITFRLGCAAATIFRKTDQSARCLGHTHWNIILSLAIRPNLGIP